MRTVLKVFVISVLPVVAGWYAFDNTPPRFFAYPPSGPMLVPGFSDLERVGVGCGVAVATLSILVGLALLVRPMDWGRRALVIAAVTGWTVVGLFTAFMWSMVDARQTYLARVNSAGLNWLYVRAAVIGLCWAGVLTAAGFAMRRWWPATQPNRQQTGAA
jgi:MFS family permease